MLHSQSNVVGGNGEEALQLRVCTQVGSVGLQEGFQSAVAHILHDENVGLCIRRERMVVQWSYARFQVAFLQRKNSVCKGLSPSVVFQSSNCRMFLWCSSFLMMETSVSTFLGRTPGEKPQKRN